MNDPTLTPFGKVPIYIIASVYRMSAGNCMSLETTNNQKSIGFNAHQRTESLWESYRHKQQKSKLLPPLFSTPEDSSGCSTMGSTCSSRSDSPDLKPRDTNSTKKRSRHILLREVRRLRGENTLLRTSVSILNKDLDNINLSRQDKDAAYKRSYEDALNKNTQLEGQLAVYEDEIKLLKEKIQELKLTNAEHNNEHHDVNHSNSGPTLHKNSNLSGYYEFEEDKDRSTLPDLGIEMDNNTGENDENNVTFVQEDEDQKAAEYLKRRAMDYGISSDTFEEDEEEEDDVSKQEPFEAVVVSQIQQAILSKLNSAHVHLELNDLIIKYEPSTDQIISALTTALLQWMTKLSTDVLSKHTSSRKAKKDIISRIDTKISKFWNSVLQPYTFDDESQLKFLKLLEEQMEQDVKNTDNKENILVGCFHRLLLMLYTYDVVDEDAVLEWWREPINNEISETIRNDTSLFIKWLQDQQEEEEGEESDDDEEKDEQDDNSFAFEDDVNFEFTELSSVSEQDEESKTGSQSSDDKATTSQPLLYKNNIIDDLLSLEDRKFCECQFDSKDTTQDTMSILKHACSCDNSTYSPQPVIEKKKKSVRIDTTM